MFKYGTGSGQIFYYPPSPHKLLELWGKLKKGSKKKRKQGEK
jgi:hypothetical protein